MANHILLVFEGEKAEERIFNNLNQYFINEDENTILISVFGTTIYTLFNEIQDDSYLDLFTLIKDKQINKDKLSGISSDEVSEIYLFFDYDGHASNASDNKITEMLDFFVEETDNGKLYLSYPMLESLKHLKSDTPFQGTVAKCSTEYKKFVNRNCDECFIDVTRLTRDNWSQIISEHSKKLNYLVMGEFSLPNQLITQNVIFSNQKEKYIDCDSNVAVLSAFPIFVVDYYGYESIPKLIDQA